MTTEEIRFLLNMELKNAEDVEKFTIKIGKLFNDMKLNPKIASNLKEIITDLEKSLDKVQKQAAGGIYDDKSLGKFKATMQEIVSLQNRLLSEGKKVTPEQFATAISVDPKTIEAETKAINDAQQAQKNFYDESAHVKKILEEIAAAKKKIGEKKTFENITGDLAKSEGKFDRINQIIASLKKIKEFDTSTIVTQLQKAQAEYDGYTRVIEQNQAAIAAKSMTTEEAAKVQEKLDQKVKESIETSKNYVVSVEEISRASINAGKNVDRLISRFEYFFSITNAFRLLSRTIRSAFSTVKELDAAMTETATVTEYSVSEMWDKLDDYTAIANKLGATTLGTYKTITLFFQQGLNEQQSLALATETMKMARVAGIDYAEATQYMTSALRGFNMELNETSATRVNDVYSELAKITAADTEQIAVAMSKVASLANSANMELETTSAILSQIIETTQEAPETAGTALKTIIARFAEVKKLYSEGELTGADDTGEEIDVNKVGVALRKAGINLNDFITGNKGLDEIFLELSKKWNSLDLVTQRYIATMAAGSRQQSRFIAMMQDYDRLLELTTAAYNSAGSGQEQFEKTLESMEAKLNELKNAWNSFTMSIANSDVLKAAVDGLTTLLTVINKITDAFGSASGMLKLFLTGGLAKAITMLASPALSAAKEAGGPLANRLLAARGALGLGATNLRNSFIGLFNPEAGLEAQKRTLNEFKESAEASNDAEKVKIYNQQLANVEKQLEPTILKTKKLGAAIQGLGVVLKLGSNYLREWADSLPDENKAKSTITFLAKLSDSLGNVAMAAGTLTRIFPEAAKSLGQFVISGSGLLTIGGLLSAIGLSAWLLKINNDSKAARESFYDLNNELISVKANIDLLVNESNGLAELDKNSLAWAVALEKVKQQYEDLIKLNPLLQQLGIISFDENNGIIFDEDKYQKYLEYTKNTAKYGQINNIAERNFATETKRQTVYLNKNGEVSQNFKRNELFSQADFLSLFPEATIDQYNQAIDAVYEKGLETANYNRSGMLTEIANLLNLDKSDVEILFKTIIDPDELRNTFLQMYLYDFMVQMIPELAEESKKYFTDLKGQNIYANYGNDYTSEGQKKLTEQLDASMAEDESATALYGYWSNLEKLPSFLEKDSNALKGLALEVSSALKRFENLNEVLDKNKDLLNSGAENSEAYGVAIGKVWAAMQKIGSGISYEFVKNNIDDIMKAFNEGSEEALWKIQEELIKTFDINQFLKDNNVVDENQIPISLDEAKVQEIRDTLTELTSDKEFKVNGVGDFTALWTALTETAGLSEEVAEAIVKNFLIEGHLVPHEDGSFHYDVSSVGLQDVRNISAGSKSKGGGSKKKNAWENPYDQLYNLTERNEEAIRRRNILEKEYNAILRDRLGSSSQLLKNSLQELANLQEQLAYQRRLQEGRIAQLNAVEGEMYTNSEGKRQSYADWGVTQYAHYNQQTNTIEIDWDAIDQVTDEEKGKAIEDYIKRLEELQKLYEQTQSDILDIEAAIDEINERGKKDYLTFEQRIYDAIVKQYQDQIDAYASLSEQIDEANQEILDQLNEQIELERQIRDNTKKEEEIADKEARLAYLQRDTSGANQTEILALQKEIEEARQSYQDDLIDQQIEQIQKGNEAASEQRQKQIELMQAQLDYWTEIGAFWSRVSELIDEGINDDGTLKNNSELVQLLERTEGFIGMSEFGKMNWMNELVKTFMQSMEGFGKWMMEQAENEGTITQDGLTYTYNKDKKAWMLGDEAYSAVYDPATGQYIFTRNPTNDVTTGAIGGSGNGGGGGSGGGGGGTGGGKTKIYYIDYNGQHLDSYEDKDEKRMKEYLAHLVYNAKYSMDELKKKYDKLQSDYYTLHNVSPEELNKVKRQYEYALDDYKKWSSATIKYHYLHGGMADYTGPAWLDGTRTRPEAVLNADQTKLFISLRDILSNLKSRGGRLNELHGDTYVDLDVNANIGSDYDVDSLVTRLKRDILESSNYRNANVLSRGY